MQFDGFYQTVGAFGRYQKIKYFLVCLTYMLPPIMVYTWTFTAAIPSFRCRTSIDGNDMSNRSLPSQSQCREYKKQISVRECQRCYQIRSDTDDFNDKDGPLKACTDFVFDRTYYQSTLVEEVCLQSMNLVLGISFFL